MKYTISLTLSLLFPLIAYGQTYPTTTTPAQSYTNTVRSNPAGTANPPGNDTSLIPTATQLLDQVYPPPPRQQSAQTTTTPTTATKPETPKKPLKIHPWSDESVRPLESWLPGIATIKDNKWIVGDYFYNLSSDISVRIDVVHPRNTSIPVTEGAIDKLVRGMLEETNIRPEAQKAQCQPALPTLYILVMAYPCDRVCVGFVSMQLFEKGQPARIDIDLDGVWQVITWARQGLVVAECEDFSKEVLGQIEEILGSFLKTYRFYHAPEPTRHCFPPSN